MSEYFQRLVRGEARGLFPLAQRAGLRLLAGPYALAVSLRNGLYDRGWTTSYRAAVPVVSVGNLSVGGTGKTPCVEYLARFFRTLGSRVAILSRGYGSSTGPNDEALVLEENLPDVPHLQGADRAGLARIAVEELESEVLLLDDGFQHRRLARDFDLVLVDATEPWGHGYLLPRGLLREPRHSLRRASAILLTHCELATAERLTALRAEIARLAPGVPVAEAEHAATGWVNAQHASQPIGAFAGRPAAGFCGIGNPEAFRQSLGRLGLDVVGWRTFPDHHAYTRADVEALCRWAGELPAETIVVTTQKDLVKIRLSHLGERELWAVAIALEVRSGREELERRLQRLIVPRDQPAGGVSLPHEARAY